MVLRMEDNLSPYLTMVETAEPTAPDAGQQRLYVDPVTHLLMIVDSTGAQSSVAGTAGLTDPMTTRGDIIVRNASNVTARLAIGSSGKVLQSDGTDISWQTPAGGSSLSYQQTFLGSDTTMTSANTFYDGPTVTLSAGTWFLQGNILGLDSTGAGGTFEVKLWNGTTVLANTKLSGTATPQWLGPFPLSGVVVIASGTPTWKMSAASTGTGHLIKAAGDGNISGNIASVLTAIQIA